MQLTNEIKALDVLEAEVGNHPPEGSIAYCFELLDQRFSVGSPRTSPASR